VPRLEDDGSTVTLDAHGLSVSDAEALILRTVRAAAGRNRVAVRVIHGGSSSDPEIRNRTIKHALEERLADGSVPGVTGVIRDYGATVLGLPLGGRPHPARLTLRDVW
jgi:hypothetical protein